MTMTRLLGSETLGTVLLIYEQSERISSKKKLKHDYYAQGETLYAAGVIAPCEDSATQLGDETSLRASRSSSAQIGMAGCLTATSHARSMGDNIKNNQQVSEVSKIPDVMSRTLSLWLISSRPP